MLVQAYRAVHMAQCAAGNRLSPAIPATPLLAERTHPWAFSHFIHTRSVAVGRNSAPSHLNGLRVPVHYMDQQLAAFSTRYRGSNLAGPRLFGVRRPLSTSASTPLPPAAQISNKPAESDPAGPQRKRRRPWGRWFIILAAVGAGGYALTPYYGPLHEAYAPVAMTIRSLRCFGTMAIIAADYKVSIRLPCRFTVLIRSSKNAPDDSDGDASLSCRACS